MKTVKVMVKREQVEQALGERFPIRRVSTRGVGLFSSITQAEYLCPNEFTLELPVEQIHMEHGGPLNDEQRKSLQMTYTFLAELIRNEALSPETRLRASICFEHFPGPERIEMLGGQQKSTPITCAHDFVEIDAGAMGNIEICANNCGSAREVKRVSRVKKYKVHHEDCGGAVHGGDVIGLEEVE